MENNRYREEELENEKEQEVYYACKNLQLRPNSFL